MELTEWIKHAADQCFTIGDIKRLNPGDTVMFLTLHRNFTDTVLEINVNPPGIMRLPKDFFRYNFAKYTHITDLRGNLVFYFNGLDNTGYVINNFEFHIEYAPECWYPVENSYFPESDIQGVCDFKFDRPIHWSEFPDKTRIGYRGPMLTVEKMNKQPDIYARSAPGERGPADS